MKKLKPACSNTVVGSDPHEWTPNNFDDFLNELEHIIRSCSGNNPLFRGHADSKWLLESTFVRTCKKILFSVEPHVRLNEKIRESVEYHQALFSLFLLKYDVLVHPSIELKSLEKKEDIDALFELMKRCQQYPEEDETSLKGTFFLDWSQSKDVALFFANFDANKCYIKYRKGDGALFICDKTATGKTLQRIKVEEIIKLMVEESNKGQPFGCPLLFYPEKQIHNKQANHQDTVYWAQMDLRYDLEYIWKLREAENSHDKYIFIKLILPDGTQNECEDYLNDKGITHRFLFPPK